jgi:hypothetical protein
MQQSHGRIDKAFERLIRNGRDGRPLLSKDALHEKI